MKRVLSRAAVAIGVALTGLVWLALVFGGPGTYRDIARAESIDRATFHSSTGTWHLDLDTLVALHEGTLAYVTARANILPSGPGGAPFYGESERAHLADVHAVFTGFLSASVLALAGTLVIVLLTGRGGRRPVLRLVRDAAALAGAGAAAVALVAAVAFDPLFLLFHEVFFPQGNFLFAPDSNLITLYPDPYWYGVTLRVGLSFVVVVGAIAGGAELGRRRLNSRG